MRFARTAFLALITIVGFSFITADAESFVASKTTRSMDEQVYKKLKGLQHTGPFDFIDWKIEGSTVTLNGKVISLGTKELAARLVKDIPGVTSVVNNIENLPASGIDARIRHEALREFTSHGPAQYFSEIDSPVRIIVENGRIRLEGYVARKSDSNLLNILANSISGVFSVTNNLMVGERKF